MNLWRRMLSVALCGWLGWVQVCAAQQPTQQTATQPVAPAGAQTPTNAAPLAGANPASPASPTSGQKSASKSGAADDKDATKTAAGNVDGIEPGKPLKENRLRAERKAAKLYLSGVKLLAKHDTEAGLAILEEASQLDPDSVTYRRAAGLARESLVAQLDVAANAAEAKGDQAEAMAKVEQALKLDGQNDVTIQTLRLLAGNAAPDAPALPQDASAKIAAQTVALMPSTGRHSFHLRMSAPELIRQVFAAYGVTAEVHASLAQQMARLAIDDADFQQATAALELVTDSFYVPLDQYRVLVAKDTKENHTNLDRQEMETVYMPGLTAKELTDVSNMAHNVFGVKQAIAQPSAETVTVRAPMRTLGAFNETVQELIDGHNQIDLNVKIIQLAHVSMQETGATFLQQTGVYNAYSEIQSILTQNASAIQQIISSGLVPNANTLANQIAIVAILAASGSLTGTPFNQGFIPFGKGLTQSLATPSPATLTLSLNSSDTRTLNDVHLRLGDDEEGTIKDGEKYPIETASYSSAQLSPAISAAATAAGYGALAQSQNIPQIQYEDLGLTLQTRAKMMRSGDVALTMSLKIESLSGSSLNGIPVLANTQFDGVLTLRAGETAVLFSDLSRQESRVLNGLPGLADIPGMQDINDIQLNQNVARLIVVVTPTLARSTQPKGHSPMLMVEKNSIQ